MGARRLTSAALTCVITSVLLSGCSQQGPGNPVGTWVSTDNKSVIEINSNGTGRFTLCTPDTSHDGQLYRYTASRWPSSIAITWASQAATIAGPPSVNLYQDWALHEATGVGFDAKYRILNWVNGHLEMNVDIVVVYEKTSEPTAHCPSK